MRNRFDCPNAVRTKIDVLMCKLRMVDGQPYNTASEIVTAMCGHQKQCNCTNRVENSEGAEECYRYLSAHPDVIKPHLLRQEINNEPNKCGKVDSTRLAN
nr:MAG TPA: hypothetical protein [Caudoviricetes sp.]